MGMEELIEQVSRDRRIKYLHFWGHAPRRDGSVGASCLSQWWPSPFVVDGVRYATAEHWMMAHKARDAMGSDTIEAIADKGLRQGRGDRCVRAGRHCRHRPQAEHLRCRGRRTI